MAGKRALRGRTAARRPKGNRGDIERLLGLALAAAGRNELAEADGFLAQALGLAPKNADLHHNRAEIRLALGDIPSALAGFSRALGLKPNLEPTAVRLAHLLGRVMPETPEILDAAGLAAAFHHTDIDREVIARAAFARLTDTPPLQPLLAAGRTGGWPAASERLLGREGRGVIKDALFLGALSYGICRRPDLENLLTAVRRDLLLARGEDLARDKPLADFACALARQCLNNEYVFAVAEGERQAIAELSGEAAPLLLSLYVDPETLAATPGIPEANRLRPRPLRDMVEGHLGARTEERALAETVPVLGPLTDPVSREVARQ